jgi:hypothetical protein
MQIDSESLRYVVSKYEEEQEKLSAFLADGNAKSYEQYREMCGQIRGLQVAAGMLKDLAKSTEDDDD